jgi:hypothetical protein
MASDSTQTDVPATASAPAHGLAPRAALGQFGQYELLDPFPGGMGIVYRARHTVLDRIVALKVLSPGRQLTEHDRVRFETEARAIAQLRHPHIIEVQEFGEHDDRPYFTMEFIEGGNLSKRVGEFAGQARRAAALVEKVARAVQHAHDHRILHRDLKPANILLRGSDDPVVADFGLAKMLDDDLSLTSTGAILGTPPYMAPEQFLGRHDLIGPATDVWALGVILHELLTGRRPFAGSSREEVASTVLTTEPQPPSKLDPSVPSALDPVVLRCLCREPSERYASAGELADELSRWLAGQRPKTRRPLTRAARRRRRRYAFAAVALLALIFATGVGVMIWWRSLDHEAKLRHELALTGRVDLVGTTGPPRLCQKLMGSFEDLTPAEDGAFTIKTDGVCLLELMSTTGQDRFHFRADIQHVEGRTGSAGLYVGRRGFKPKGEEWHCFLLSHVARPMIRDNLPGQVRPDERFADARSFEIKYVESDTQRLISGHSFDVPHGPWAQNDWERIDFDVSPESINVAFGGMPGTRVSRSSLMKTAGDAALARPNFGSITPVYDPRDGIGIFAYRCTVRVRNAIVELAP